MEVASVPCHADRSPWSGPLFIGQYGADPGPPYQVSGRVAHLRLYRRGITTEDAESLSRAGKR